MSKKIIVITCSIVLALAILFGGIFGISHLNNNNEGVLSFGSDTITPTDESDNASLQDTSNSESSAKNSELIISSPTQPSVETAESFYTFSGSSDPSEQLTFDGKAVERDKSGVFSFTVNLSLGENTFSFTYKGKTVTYTINYKYIIIKEYAPDSQQTYSAGSTFAVSVTARKGSSVTALFCGKILTLAPSSKTTGSNSQFVEYKGNFKLPSNNSSDLNLGSITFTAVCDGKSESYRSGDIICRKPEIQVIPSPDTTPTGGKYINVGAGKIAEIVAYEAETFDPYSTDDCSRPTNNYLPKGTVDYCAQEYYYYGNKKTYALLRYGRQVYTVKKEENGKSLFPVIKEYAGTLPDHNEISIASFSNNGRHTVLTLDTMWKAPFYFDLLNQGYTNPSTQNYTLSAVTYTYVDITFCYATVFKGDIVNTETGTVNLPSNPLFDSAKLINNMSNTNTVRDFTLRLYLKKQGAFYGWDANYNSSGQLVFEFLNPAPISIAQNSYGVNLSGVKILIDVGHGGSDPGATGFGDRVHTEAERNLNLALKVKFQLESIGATVYMTRTSDSTCLNDNKIQNMKNLKPDFCIAIHHDASDSSGTNGFGSYYFSPFSKKSAELIYNYTQNTNIYRNSKLSWHYYYMARCSYCPVVLMENGFITNSYDFGKIISDSANDTKAYAITQGIVEHFKYIQ